MLGQVVCVQYSVITSLVNPLIYSLIYSEPGSKNSSAEDVEAKKKEGKVCLRERKRYVILLLGK